MAFYYQLDERSWTDLNKYIFLPPITSNENFFLGFDEHLIKITCSDNNNKTNRKGQIRSAFNYLVVIVIVSTIYYCVTLEAVLTIT